MIPLPTGNPRWRDAHELSLALIEAMREERNDDVMFVLRSLYVAEEGPGYELAVTCLAKLVAEFADQNALSPECLRRWAARASQR